MNLTEKQIQTQNAILKAVHGTDDIEEAREKDLWFWCVIENDADDYNSIYFTQVVEINDSKVETLAWTGYDRIIWQPPTLSRVLKVLGIKEGETWNWYFASHTWKIAKYTRPAPAVVCNWELLKEDGTDATLRDQSEEVQNAIHDLLC